MGIMLIVVGCLGLFVSSLKHWVPFKTTPLIIVSSVAIILGLIRVVSQEFPTQTLPQPIAVPITKNPEPTADNNFNRQVKCEYFHGLPSVIPEDGTWFYVDAPANPDWKPGESPKNWSKSFSIPDIVETIRGSRNDAFKYNFESQSSTDGEVFRWANANNIGDYIDCGPGFSGGRFSGPISRLQIASLNERSLKKFCLLIIKDYLNKLEVLFNANARTDGPRFFVELETINCSRLSLASRLIVNPLGRTTKRHCVKNQIHDSKHREHDSNTDNTINHMFLSFGPCLFVIRIIDITDDAPQKVQ